MILDFEKAIGGTIYRQTAKKILNNWFSWAVEQRSALINLISRKKMNEALSHLHHQIQG